MLYLNRYKPAQHQITVLSPIQLKIKITTLDELSLRDISIEIEQNNVNVPVPEFTFQIDGLPVTVIALSDRESTFMKDMSTVSRAIMTTTEKIYLVLKSCVASYFLINIINFWNLILMYNVLKISTIPSFSKYFLEKLTFLFFNLNSLS